MQILDPALDDDFAQICMLVALGAPLEYLNETTWRKSTLHEDNLKPNREFLIERRIKYRLNSHGQTTNS
jgi:hypothetical protein